MFERTIVYVLPIVGETFFLISKLDLLYPSKK